MAHYGAVIAGSLLLIIGASALPTRADVIFSDDFESYSTGAFPTANDSWSTYGTPGGTVEITDSQAHGGDQSLKMNGYTNGVTHGFTRQTTGEVSLTFWWRDSFETIRGTGLALYDGSKGFNDGRAAYVSMNPGGKSTNPPLAYETASGFVDVPDFTIPRNTWFKVTLDLNLGQKTFDIYVNDDLKVNDAALFSKASGATGIDHIYIDHKQNATGWTDDVSVTAVPEPGTLGLMGLGGALLLSRKRRRG